MAKGDAGQVHFPPGPGPGPTDDVFGVISASQCVKYGEEITLVFDDTGVLAYAPPGNFTPDFPMGYFPKGKMTPPSKAASHDADIIMCFFDLQTFQMSTVTLQIRASCPGQPKKKSKKS
jgi:hypothetical protein